MDLWGNQYTMAERRAYGKGRRASADMTASNPYPLGRLRDSWDAGYSR